MAIKLGIVTVPYLQSDRHVDMMVDSYETFITKHKTFRVAILNAFRDNADIKRVSKYNELIIENDENCLARAWNIGVRECLSRGCDYVFIPNLDVKIADGALDGLLRYAQTARRYGVFSLASQRVYESVDVDQVNSFDNYASLLVRASTFRRLAEKDAPNEPYRGMFDENIRPAYCEDLDFQRRLDLAGIRHRCDVRFKFWHYVNGTLKLHPDPKWAWANLTQFAGAADYMKKKWGGIRKDMKYKTPFNVI